MKTYRHCDRQHHHHHRTCRLITGDSRSNSNRFYWSRKAEQDIPCHVNSCGSPALSVGLIRMWSFRGLHWCELRVCTETSQANVKSRAIAVKHRLRTEPLVSAEKRKRAASGLGSYRCHCELQYNTIRTTNKEDDVDTRNSFKKKVKYRIDKYVHFGGFPAPRLCYAAHDDMTH
jgi:hypothetical protein